MLAFFLNEILLSNDGHLGISKGSFVDIFLLHLSPDELRVHLLDLGVYSEHSG